MGAPIHRADGVRPGVSHRRARVMRSATAPARVEVAAVVVEVSDLDRATAFWTGLLGSSVLDQGDGWVDVALLGVNGPALSLQQARGRRWRRSRLHLDVVVDDVEQAVSRAVLLGGSTGPHVPGAGSARWQVLSDPDGNELCLLERD
jgi:catechol 2,3-dioxygenase-like lactoylglutathione lyase family enzyme